MSSFKKYILFFLGVLFAADAAGQAARSPYTSLGIGEPYGTALANTQGMGGVGVSQPQFWYLNNQNPALLVYNNLTVFQAGMLVESRTIRNDTASEKNVGGNLNYLVTAFPIRHSKKNGLSTWVTSVGLLPYTTVNYQLDYDNSIENSPDLVEVSERGEGGLTQLYWSNGVRLSPSLAVGLKAAYIFGSIQNTYSNLLKESNQPANYFANVEDKMFVKDFLLSAGVSFSKDSLFRNHRYRLSFGAVYGLKTDLTTQFRREFYRSTRPGNKLQADTLFSIRGSYAIPSSITAGVSLSRGSKWVLGTEFNYQDWTSFSSPNSEQEGLGPSWRAAFGGEFTPDAISGGFFKRITYRAGVSAEQYPFLANNNEVNDIGANFGFSLPAGRSSIDFAFKVGKRGNRSENILEESYFRAYFGITFNDQWFIKRKFD